MRGISHEELRRAVQDRAAGRGLKARSPENVSGRGRDRDRRVGPTALILGMSLVDLAPYDREEHRLGRPRGGKGATASDTESSQQPRMRFARSAGGGASRYRTNKRVTPPRSTAAH